MIACALIPATMADFAQAQTRSAQKFYRPQRTMPPVHAAPAPRQAPAATYTYARPDGNVMPNQYPVQQAAAYQHANGTITHPHPSHNGVQQFQQHPPAAMVEDDRQFLRHVAKQYEQENSGHEAAGSRYQPSTLPETEMPAIDQQGWQDAPPALEDYSTDPFTEEVVQESVNQAPQSVLVQEDLAAEPPRYPEPAQVVSQPVQHSRSANQLRGLQVEPRRLRDSHSATRFRNAAANRVRQDDGSDLYQGIDDAPQARSLKSCDDYRRELLNSPITDIVLDISPLRPTTGTQGNPAELTRTWTDCNGNILGSGTLLGLERSYVVIQDEEDRIHQISRTKLSDADLAVVTEYWGLPNECRLGCYTFEGRNWQQHSFFWKASALCHKPLYFENRQLERYGHTHGPIVQPVHSTVHFFTNLVFWPYNAGINSPNECLYALGFYRPGDCAPWLKDPLPISMHGALYQAAFIGGYAAIIP